VHVVQDFSEVLIELLNHQIIPLFFSPRTSSQVMFALLCHGRLAQYCCMVCPDFSFFSFVIVLVFVRFACRNFYFYIVFVFQIAIVLVFVLTERSAIVLVFVFVTKIALLALLRQTKQ